MGFAIGSSSGRSNNATSQKVEQAEQVSMRHTQRNDTKTEVQWRWIWIHLVICVVCIVCTTILTFVIVTWTCSTYSPQDSSELAAGDSLGDERNVSLARGNASEGITSTSALFVEREDWGGTPPARPLNKLKLPVPYVIISHSGTDGCRTKSECTFHVRFAQTFHMESRRWADIAYNFLAGGDGLIYAGRGWDHVGAHTFSLNNRSIGIAFIGTFDSVEPAEAQLDAVRKLIQLGVETGKISPDYKLLGQRQVSQTLSPGDALYDIIKRWPHWSLYP